MMWMFIAILATFLITRTVTRLIRSGSGAGAGLGNVRLAGVHVHHQVFGILIIIGTGIVLVSVTPHGAALDVAAVIFGVGISLTLDEFALWLHLQDVYWTTEGRKSVDAIFCVLAVTGALIGGTDFLSGRIGTATWWSSVSVPRGRSHAERDMPAQRQGHNRRYRHRHQRRRFGRRGEASQTGVVVGDALLRQPAPASGTRRASLRPSLPAALESVAGSRRGRPLPGTPALATSAKGHEHEHAPAAVIVSSG
jgi:hypothetical protein